MADFSKFAEQVDSLFPSPNERAHEIWSIISATPQLIEKTDWDLLCFAVEYIAMMSQNWHWLEEDAKKLTNLLYTAHYLSAENYDDKKLAKRNIGGGGDSLILDDSRETSKGESSRNESESISPRIPFE